MAVPHRVEVTTYFLRGLAQIEDFLDANEATDAYDQLLDELIATVIPNLESFPKLGPLIQGDAGQSIEVHSALRLLERQLGRLARHTEVREYVMKDYLVLYARPGVSFTCSQYATSGSAATISPRPHRKSCARTSQACPGAMTITRMLRPGLALSPEPNLRESCPISRAVSAYRMAPPLRAPR